jgi:hypothetical protein
MLVQTGHHSRRVDTPLTRLTLPMFIHALDNDLYFYQITLDFHHKSCSPFFVPVFNKLRWDVIVRFVDIGGNVDHECLSLLSFHKQC